MIYFHQVFRDLVDEKRGRRPGLRDFTAAIPGNARVAVIGHDRSLLTTFLHLAAGSEIPERGQVVAEGIRLSPIVNSGGVAASCLSPQLTATENLRFFARLHGIDAISLLRLVEDVCNFGPLLKLPVRAFEPTARRALETALIAALPYDCYMIDRIEMLPPEVRWLIVHSARIRGAGVIFTTNSPRVAKPLGNIGLVVDDGWAQLFPELNEALTSVGGEHDQDEAELSDAR